MIAHEWSEPTGRTQPATVSDRLYWSYANLAMAHAALNEGAGRYRPFPHFQIRARLYAGLRRGSMSVGPLFDDERAKILSTLHCSYCGMSSPETVDHLLPRVRGGDHSGENLVPCCRRCNSAKGAKDVMAWHRDTQRFPALSVVRRYLKLAIFIAQKTAAMDYALDDAAVISLPFDIRATPMNYPNPDKLVWTMGN